MLRSLSKRAFLQKLIDGRYVFPYISARSRQQRERQYGEVSEWLKEHAWKVCIRQRIGVRIPPHRHILRRARTQVRGFFRMWHPPGMRTPDRGSTTGAASWTEPLSLRAGYYAGASEASQSPPHRHIQDESLYASTGLFSLYSLPGSPSRKANPEANPPSIR